MKLTQLNSNKNYFISIFIFAVLVFLAFSSILYRQYTDNKIISDNAMRQYELLRRARQVYVVVLNLETGARGYLLTGKREFLQPYDMAQKVLHERVEGLKEFATGASEAEQALQELDTQTIRFLELLTSQIAAYDAKGKSTVTEETLDLQKRAMDTLRKPLDTFLKDGQIDLQNQIRVSDEKNAGFLTVLVVGTLIALASMLAATLLLFSLLNRSRRAEDRVREKEERMLTIMNAVNEGLFDFDVKKQEIYFSPSYKSMLGYTDKEHPDTLEALKQHLHPEDQDVMEKITATLGDRDTPVYSETFRLRDKDGGWHWVLSRGIGEWDGYNELVRIIGTHTDITAQKNREEELKQLNSDMESFIYIASHDLRSPLVNLKGFTGEIEHALRQVRPVIERNEHKMTAEEDDVITSVLDKDIPESLNFITKAVDQMDRLTSAILDLSRIGKRDLRIETVDIDALVKRSLDNLAYVISQKKADVECEPLPPIVSDPLALEHIFNNLLDNAVKYLSPERRGKIVISSHNAGKDIIFSVKDNGRGIAREDRKKIFEIFRRARNTGDVQGLGMGMAYVKTTARKLGGSIWLDSELDEGTTFYVRLPAYLEAERIKAREQL